MLKILILNKPQIRLGLKPVLMRNFGLKNKTNIMTNKL